MKKIIFMIIGFIALAFGLIGILVPLFPTVPFLLLASIMFAKSSDKVNSWFKSTKIYQNHLESYVNKQGMLLNTKLKIMLMVTILLGIACIMMKDVFIGQIVIIVVWICHILYFTFKVKTI